MIITSKDGINTPENMEHFRENDIFVFGSNRSGHHEGGAARFAYEHLGAEWGVGEGLTGQCYALPTVDWKMKRPLFLREIRNHLATFFDVASKNPDKEFWLTKIGCGVVGYKPSDIKYEIPHAMRIAIWARGADEPKNIHYPEEFTDKPLYNPVDLTGMDDEVVKEATEKSDWI